MKSVEFMVHKDKFIKYLNEFVQELQRHSKRMEQLLEKNTECMENTILERVVASELDIPHALLEIHGNAEPRIVFSIHRAEHTEKCIRKMVFPEKLVRGRTGTGMRS